MTIGGTEGNNAGPPADPSETQPAILPPTENEAQEQADEVQQGASDNSSDDGG